GEKLDVSALRLAAEATGLGSFHGAQHTSSAEGGEPRLRRALELQRGAAFGRQLCDASLELAFGACFQLARALARDAQAPADLSQAHLVFGISHHAVFDDVPLALVQIFHGVTDQALHAYSAATFDQLVLLVGAG